MTTVAVMAGGTGGHIFPALATARALGKRGINVHWLGAQGAMEAELVPQHDLPIELLPIDRLRGKGLRRWLTMPASLTRAVWVARRALRHMAADLAISFGGFASGPGGLAIRSLARPLLVHEQNARPGLTNRVLAKVAARRLCGFPDALANGIWTGNPVRDAIANLPPPTAREMTSGKLRLLVLGGSQGALALNETVPAALAKLPTTAFSVVHQCGKGHLAQTQSNYQDLAAQYQVSEFMDDMPTAYAQADLVIARAGASTISELCAVGLGAILVPFPHAVDDHQTANARWMVDAGAAQLMPQSQLGAAGLAASLQRFIDQPQQRLELANAARSLAKPDAAAVIADHCLEVLQ